MEHNDDYTNLGLILMAMDMIDESSLKSILLEQKCRDYKIKLGELLLLHGQITEDQLNEALVYQNALRGRSKYVRSKTLANLAIKMQQRKESIRQRQRIKDKAKEITDEYPAIVDSDE